MNDGSKLPEATPWQRNSRKQASRSNATQRRGNAARDLLGLFDTQTQMIIASWELHRFFHDCKTLEHIFEKQNIIPDELGKDAKSVAALQRRHANFEHDLVTIGTQVHGIQEDASKLLVQYSGDKAREIQEREMEVVNAWRNLQMGIEARKRKLADTSDLYRFFNLARDLMLWMEDMIRQMNTQVQCSV